MFLTPSKKIALVFLTTTIIALSLFFISCQKELSGAGIDLGDTLPDLTTKIASSVSGFVTDENEVAVNGAAVQFGSSNTTTDKYGYFELSNVQVCQNAAVVTIIKPGYFKGIKTYIATAGKSAFFRIKLLPKSTTGNIDAASGGSVTLTNGLSISLAAGAVVNASTNAVYTGSVIVAAQWLDPTAGDLNRTMPGDLRGLDSLNFMKVLTTYGMAAVELTGTSGELLQVAAGKKAVLSFPIPSGISSSAPSTIPLWYFDEALGLWKQDGSAVRTGNNYIGEVSHFSFWNCDVPANFVYFDCTIVDAKNMPLPNVLVKISIVSNLENGKFGYTDSSGFTKGAIPNNSSLLLEVFSDNSCTTPVYSKNFNTGTSNISLGNIVIPSTVTATVSGSVANCSLEAVTNGYVLMIKNGINYSFPVSSTGTFSFNTTICDNNTEINLIGEDVAELQSGSPSTITLNSGNNQVGILQACGTSIEQFITYTINGDNYSLVSPANLFIHMITPPVNYVSGNVAGTQLFTTAIGFSDDGTAVGSTQALTTFRCPQINDSTEATFSGIFVNITEFGAIGQFISGNFTGTFTGAPPANTTYNVTCSFRIRRNQ